MSRSIREIGRMAYQQYPPVDARVQEAGYEQWVEDGWRQFVQAVGGIYQARAALPLTIGEIEFTLPADLRAPLAEGVYLTYTPRAIATIGRSGNVATVETQAAHGLQSGMHVRIADVAGDGFDQADVAAAVLSPTQFTYPNTGADGAGSGGEVRCVSTTRRPLELVAVGDDAMERLPVHLRRTGTPTHYYYLNALTLGIYPASDGRTFPELIVEYDAGAPDTLDRTLALPVPAWVERGLAAYAGAVAGGRGELRGMFESLVTEWKRAATLREEANRR